jgi:[protein-PII] uridylyltransferase
MPTDTVHEFTVFEHTMQVIRNLDNARTDPFSGELIQSLGSPDALYLAALLHDVGKIDRSLPHSESGARIAEKVCARWQLDSNLSNQIVWLVKEHLTMARFIRMRDLMHPDTTEEFAEIVGDPQRLTMLTLLTAADIAAVSSSTYTPAIATFLRQLYESTASVLHRDGTEDDDPLLTRKRLLRSLASSNSDPDDVSRYLDEMPTYYLASTPTDIARLHMHYVTEARAERSTIDFTANQSLAATEITVCTRDKSGLLNQVLGVLYAFDLSLLAVRATTTRGTPAIALDTFVAGFAGKPVPASTLRELQTVLQKVIDGELPARDVILSRGKDPDRRQRLFTYTYQEGTPGILDIRAPRGRGMPYRFSKIFAEQGWNIVSARVGQWAGSGAASFYITHADGAPVPREKVSELLDALRQVNK